MLYTRFTLLLCLGFINIFLSSCTEHDLGKIPKTEFAHENWKVWNDAFQGLWVNPSFDRSKRFKTIYIAPTTLSYMTPKAEEHWHGEALARKAQELAQKLDTNIQGFINENPEKYMPIAKSKAKADLILELAIVKIDRTLIGLNYLTFGTSFFVPGLSYGIGYFADGDIALVGKLIDGKTKQKILEFADYRTDPPSLFGSVRDYQTYGNHELAIEMWSEQLVTRISKNRNEKVSPATWFVFNPFK